MIEDAKKHGLDLTDPMVQRELQRMDEKRRRGESLDDEEGEE
jgi:hypothetical protein